ncbi:MAG TPA: type 1 glutamine amidotransferase [Pusillimonas sp.]|uniref:type 1 glutamine amidotransferase n=1 Tax=Pusillimonas sp. TaxID=3040095 RepID=UPI002BB96F42|nr:type 1 glutamine amidotransferase [Pusillimonas sp.]HUH87480.1 type 1 glutamine amidotransferase [Pusillimonas sp.]
MKPVAIFQHTHVGQPGAVITVLQELGIPWVLVPVMDGAAIPEDPSEFSGLIFMGGSMGVNDGLAWIEDEIALIDKARQLDIPVAGHCLGGQVMAAAFGSKVSQGPSMEIGWQPIGLSTAPEAQEWFGAGTDEVFQWHADEFELPPGAVRLASSPHYANQAFVMDNRHLAMQFHLEMTPELVGVYMDANGKVLDRQLANGAPAVNTRDEIADRLEQRTAGMHAVLRKAYGRWIKGLKD